MNLDIFYVDRSNAGVVEGDEHTRSQLKKMKNKNYCLANFGDDWQLKTD